MKLFPGLILLRKLIEYSRNEKLSRAELEELQLRKFRRLAAYVRKRSPYYADIIRERNIDVKRCVPEDFPVLTKTELLKNFDRIVTDRRLTRQRLNEYLETSSDPSELFLNKYHVIQTSGTSGEVGTLVFSTADWARGIGQAGRTSPPPNHLDRRNRLAFYGAVEGRYAGVTLINTLRTGRRAKRLFDVITLDAQQPLDEVIERLNAFQPDILQGYTGCIKLLAEKQQEGVLAINPDTVKIGAEVVTEADKRYLRDVFKCPVQDLYACSEHMCVGSSYPDGSSIHLFDDDVIFDIHDDHVLTTNLFNYTLPLIRYRMSDVLIPVRNKTAHWPYLELERIGGRAEHTLRFFNRAGGEDFLNPHTIVVPGILQFQVQVLEGSRFRVIARIDPALPAETQKETLATLRAEMDATADRKNLDRNAFEVLTTERIPVDPVSKKHRLVVDMRNATAEDLEFAAEVPTAEVG